MSCFLVAAISNVWHKVLSFELSAHSVVNTFWFPPVRLQCKFSMQNIIPILSKFRTKQIAAIASY